MSALPSHLYMMAALIQVLAAFQTLAGLGALASPTEITSLGREMLKYPLDPSHARILIASYDLGCPSEIIDILSILNAGSGSVFIDRSSDRDAAAEARLKFINKDGDHLTALNVFREFITLRNLESQKSVIKWGRENHVNLKGLTQALKIRQQLQELSEKNGKDWKVAGGVEGGNVVRALLQGLFMNTAVIQADGTYRQTAGSLVSPANSRHLSDARGKGADGIASQDSSFERLDEQESTCNRV